MKPSIDDMKRRAKRMHKLNKAGPTYMQCLEALCRQYYGCTYSALREKEKPRENEVHT